MTVRDHGQLYVPRVSEEDYEPIDTLHIGACVNFFLGQQNDDPPSGGCNHVLCKLLRILRTDAVDGITNLVSTGVLDLMHYLCPEGMVIDDSNGAKKSEK